MGYFIITLFALMFTYLFIHSIYGNVNIDNFLWQTLCIILKSIVAIIIFYGLFGGFMPSLLITFSL